MSTGPLGNRPGHSHTAVRCCESHQPVFRLCVVAKVAEPHAFISYVRQDSDRVDRLQAILEAAGVKVWRDTADLWPGEDWRARIREAITKDALAFIACFSEHSESRAVSGQNEELALAVDQLRLRRPSQPWLIPVRLDDVPVPDLEIGGGRTLDFLQRVDLIGSTWDQGAARLVAGVLRILEHPAPPPPAPAVDSTLDQRLKAALRDPAGDIALSDLLLPIANAARVALEDEERFPASSEHLHGAAVDAALFVADVVDDYVSILNPAIDALVTTASWARESHLGVLTRFVERLLPSKTDQGGMVVLVGLRWFPVLPLLYAGAVASVQNENYAALRSIALDAHVRDWQDGRIPLLSRANPWRPFRDFQLTPQVLALRAAGENVTRETAEELHQRRRGNRYTPISDFLHDVLRPKFQDLIPNDENYSDLFDRTEILLALLAIDLKFEYQESRAYIDGPHYGRLTWRHPYARAEEKPDRQLFRALTDRDRSWPPLAAGLFGGSVSRATSAFEAFIAEADEAQQRRW